MSEEKANERLESSTNEGSDLGDNDLAEFEIEVRELDRPVRPRGVLAE